MDRFYVLQVWKDKKNGVTLSRYWPGPALLSLVFASVIMIQLHNTNLSYLSAQIINFTRLGYVYETKASI